MAREPIARRRAEPVLPTPSSNARVELRGVAIDLGEARGASRVVESFDASIEPGEFVCLLGPSGCGKSTVLSALAGFIAPSQGMLLIDDAPVTRPRTDVGLVFQQHTLLPWRTVEENVAFGLKMRNVPRDQRLAAARALLAMVGLAGFERRYPHELSGGMQQRAEIARVLITHPRVILMDEPFGALDAQTRLMMQEHLLDIWNRVRTTVLFVTHDIEEAIFLADRILVMSSRPGRVRDTLALDLARPRTAEITTSAAFVAAKRWCLEHVREESLKTMSARVEMAPGMDTVTAIRGQA